jgi:flavin reductase (DIM6/NTAB) family NADH-FMN oxidoreductase RutF
LSKTPRDVIKNKIPGIGFSIQKKIRQDTVCRYKAISDFLQSFLQTPAKDRRIFINIKEIKNMERIKLDRNYGPPLMPVILVGSKINNRANFFPCGWFSRVNMNPPIWMISVGSQNFTAEGIKETKTFSINYPGIELMEKADYCGLTSGKITDKSQLFSVFYGELNTAPMIEESPLCMELHLQEIKTMPAGLLIFGEVINAYSKAGCLTSDGAFDFSKLETYVVTTPDMNYRSIGNIKSPAWSIGKALKK